MTRIQELLAASVNNGLKLSQKLCRCPGMLSVQRSVPPPLAPPGSRPLVLPPPHRAMRPRSPDKWAAKVSVRAFGDELGQGSGAVVLRAVGGLCQGMGVLAHGVARDPELAGNLPQGEALDPGVLHRLPERQLPWGQLASRRTGSSSSTSAGFRLASCRNWGWLGRWLPRRFTMRLS